MKKTVEQQKKNLKKVSKMNKEFLIKIREKIIDLIEKDETDTIDKFELMLNLYEYLNPENYENDTQVLIKESEKRKWKKY